MVGGRITAGKVYWRHDKPYLVLHTARMHRSGEGLVVYVPLYLDPSWSLDEDRVVVRTLGDFTENFVDVS
jgi:hypothetical protein